MKATHLVLGIALHEIDTATNVLAVGVGGDELEVQLAAAGGDAVGARVVGAVDAALGGAVGALAGSTVGVVPGVARVAVGRALDCVSPSPVGVEHHRAGDA